MSGYSISRPRRRRWPWRARPAKASAATSGTPRWRRPCLNQKTGSTSPAASRWPTPRAPPAAPAARVPAGPPRPAPTCAAARTCTSSPAFIRIKPAITSTCTPGSPKRRAAGWPGRGAPPAM
ncbi:hypothetical protein C2862_12190 [Massilia sp. Mn16-1_5]|nr:hypothetical protein C2862_12190 [Massilia sp. Mn16-1_5]